MPRNMIIPIFALDELGEEAKARALRCANDYRGPDSAFTDISPPFSEELSRAYIEEHGWEFYQNGDYVIEDSDFELNDLDLSPDGKETPQAVRWAACKAAKTDFTYAPAMGPEREYQYEESDQDDGDE